MIYPQHLLALDREIIVELFAGGSGAGTGIEMALGRPVDVAVNHDPAACAMYRLNHPHTEVMTCDVFEVDPREVARERPVGLLWASPDCTYHSKARGAKPIRHKNRKRRALAWVITAWTGTVRPRVIAGENVEEFELWGDLVAKRCPTSGRVMKADGTVAAAGEVVPVEDQLLVPCLRRQRRQFDRWKKKTFTDQGYSVEIRQRRACDAGAPTIRKRLYFLARCDDASIVWAPPTHAAPDSAAVRAGLLKPYRTAAECIDWSIPMLSIFATREEAIAWGRARGQAPPVRPLAEATMRRIARGVMRYVVNSPKPFLVHLTHQGGRRVHPIDESAPTVTGAQRGELGLVAPVIAGVGGRAGQSRERSGGEPFQTVTAKGDSAIIAPVIVPNNTNNAPHSVEEGVPTVTGGGRNILAAPMLESLAPFIGEHANATGARSMPADEPLRTQCADVKGGHFSVVAPYLVPRYGEAPGQEPRTRSVEEPAPVIVPSGNGGSLAAVHLASYHAEKREGDVRGAGVDEPVDTLDTANRHALVAGLLAQHNGGFYTGDGRSLDGPAGTVCAEGSPQGLVAASLAKLRGTSSAADVADPLHTQSAEGTHHAAVAAHLSHMQGGDPAGGEGDPAAPLRAITSTSKASAVYAFLQKYYGTDQDPRVEEPLHTIPTKDRFGVVTVTVDGTTYVIADIAMRMLQPLELYRAQGFPGGFIFDRGLFPPPKPGEKLGRKVLEHRADGWTVCALTKTEQVRMCGNSVSPEEAAALVGANVPELRVRDEARVPAAPASKPARAAKRRRPVAAAGVLEL